MPLHYYFLKTFSIISKTNLQNLNPIRCDESSNIMNFEKSTVRISCATSLFIIRGCQVICHLTKLKLKAKDQVWKRVILTYNELDHSLPACLRAGININ